MLWQTIIYKKGKKDMEVTFQKNRQKLRKLTKNA